jgi:hypothetical protein
MFLKAHARCKDGKRHVYYSLTESLRVSRKRVVQRTVLHLGNLSALHKDPPSPTLIRRRRMAEPRI